MVPLDFMRIPLIAVIGWWLYGEPLDVFVFVGAGLIIAGILWNLRSEAKRSGRNRQRPHVGGRAGVSSIRRLTTALSSAPIAGCA